MAKKYLACIWILMMVIVVSGCNPSIKDETASLTKTTYALGTVIEINLYDEGDNDLMNRLTDRIGEIEQRMSAQIESSELSKINNASGIEGVAVSQETYYVIQKALTYAELSNGRFDPTIGPIIKLWKIGTEEVNIPSEEAIAEALKFVDYNKVILDEDNYTVFLSEKGMSLDLGGIAKGYVADALVEILSEEGITKAMINLGGNIYAYGKKANNDPWKIAIQKPFGERNEYIGYVSLYDETVVTSGPYERYFEENGKIYHHIFDAKTGYPIEGDVVSVSIVAKRSIDADALSTLLFTLPKEEGVALIESMDEIQCIYVDNDNEILLSSGLSDMFTITDKDFKLLTGNGEQSIN